MKILIADDELSLRFLVQETLADENLDLLEATDGTTALALARSEKPQLVLLDAAMPGMSGFEVCKLLKADPATSAITVVMLTAHSQSKDRDDAFANGADHFMTKPFSPSQLLKLINQLR